jgi:hypothetical protein
MGIFSKGSKNSKNAELADEAMHSIRAGIYMTFAQALNVSRQMPCAEDVPEYMKVFSSVVNNALKNNLISEYVYEAIKYSEYEVTLDPNDSLIYGAVASNPESYLINGMNLNSALTKWEKNWNIENSHQMEIFTELAVVCESLGMSKDDDKTLGLLFVTSLYYTTLLKDSQRNSGIGEIMRSEGTFFATEIPNLWLMKHINK